MIRYSKRDRGRRGVTLAEVVVTAALLTSVLTALVALSTSSSKEWARSSAQLEADSGASLALQRLAVEIRDGIAASMQSGALEVVMPAVNAEGDYNRYLNGQTNQYYVQDGVLYRDPVGAPPTALASGLTDHQFVVAGSEVRLSLTAQATEGTESAETTYATHVYLRNRNQ